MTQQDKRYETALAAYRAAVQAYDESHHDPRALAAALTAYDTLAAAAPSPERHAYGWTPNRATH